MAINIYIYFSLNIKLLPTLLHCTIDCVEDSVPCVIQVCDSVQGCGYKAQLQMILRRGRHYLFMVFYEDLHQNVLELDVHDGSHRLLLGPHQRGAEHDAQVGHRHHVDFAVIHDPEEQKRHTEMCPSVIAAVTMAS